jgi:hypothetical protein
MVVQVLGTTGKQYLQAIGPLHQGDQNSSLAGLGRSGVIGAKSLRKQGLYLPVDGALKSIPNVIQLKALSRQWRQGQTGQHGLPGGVKPCGLNEPWRRNRWCHDIHALKTRQQLLQDLYGDALHPGAKTKAP